jgi:hypothetical protein
MQMRAESFAAVLWKPAAQVLWNDVTGMKQWLHQCMVAGTFALLRLRTGAAGASPLLNEQRAPQFCSNV